jgi:TonB family protein
VRRNDVTLTIALCASLIVHGAVTAALALQYAHHLAQIYAPGSQQRSLAQSAPDPEDPFGKNDGAGNAIADFKSDLVLKGHEAPIPQAFLSRDARGFGAIGVDPSANVLPPGENGDGQPAANRLETPAQQLTRATPIIAQPTAQTAQFGPQNSLLDLKPALKLTPHATTHPAPLDKPAPKPPAETDKAAAVGGKKGPNAPSADPAPMTDSESDAFAKTPSVEISEGNVEAKLGRKVKTIRPKLSLASQLDLVGMQFPRMKLRVRIDNAGKPTKVDIIKPTGSETADQEVKLAVYQWEFAPDPKPNPGALDIVEFEIIWR